MVDIPPEYRDVADDLCAWFKRLDPDAEREQQNYTAGLTRDGKLIISKAGGLTSKTGWTAELRQWVVRMSDYWLCDISGFLLAKKFTNDNAHNHGEMCVLAASCALNDPLTMIACTGENCCACSVTLKAFGVPSMNGRSRRSQTGWVHPRGPMAVGTGSNQDWEAQIAELMEYNRTLLETGKVPVNRAFRYAKQLPSSPRSGVGELVDKQLNYLS